MHVAVFIAPPMHTPKNKNWQRRLRNAAASLLGPKTTD